MYASALVRSLACLPYCKTTVQLRLSAFYKRNGQSLLPVCKAAMSSSTAEDSWDRVLDVLSSLIKNIKRADGKTWRDAHENMPVYLERLGIQDAVQQLSVIHVAGTKGKGSTCAMVESILRSAGYSTGLFTSPHLCDVRERVRINGAMVSKAVFAGAFWRCYNTLQDKVTDAVGMPGYFRFLTLLSLQIFLDTKPDVVILEVGIGGRIDATNILRAPAATGITSLGFDHMELLGDTLDLIAAEKAGIMRSGVSCFTVPQPPEAMEALEACASTVGARLHVVQPNLSNFSAQQPISVGLAGDHQLLNASLAVALAQAWEQHTLTHTDSSSSSNRSHGGEDNASGSTATGESAVQGSKGVTQQQQQQRQRMDAAARLQQLQDSVLPDVYCEGLRTAKWPGRSQIVAHSKFLQHTSNGSSSSRLMVYLDGAHTPESMVTCAAWFAQASHKHIQQQQHQAGIEPPAAASSRTSSRSSSQPLVRVLIFNCMKERDPAVLLPQLHAELLQQGAGVDVALFVPPDSQYAFLPSSSKQALVAAAHQDLSWQQQLLHVWRQCDQAAEEAGGQEDSGFTAAEQMRQLLPKLPAVEGVGSQDVLQGSAVLSSVGQALGWLESAVEAGGEQGVQFEVLVTGSLYLVGDCLVALQQQPK